jgi:predicted glutamine amidotransferase
MDILFNSEMSATITGLLLFFIFSIIINFISTIYNKITKKEITPNTTLNCGIWAWCGKDSKKFNKSKFDMLGLYNDSRGGQGSGIYKNGEIIKSSKEKEYKDFLVNINYNNDLENPVIFGHARKSSSGHVNDINTHPFGFGEKKDGEYEFAGVHNGTLYNERELSKMFDSDYSKIDSHILLESIYKNENFKVLNHYIGAAALLFIDNNESNTLYAFRGESKKFESSNKIEDERPLYYYQESENSLYISSMMESLIAITENEKDIENIHEFKANIVYKIIDGNVEKAKQITISRKNCFQRQYNYNNNWNSKYNRINNSYENTYNKNKVKKIDLNSKVSNIKSKNTKKNKKFNILKESLKRKKGEGNNLKFEKFKYCRNGHPVTGIYLYTLNNDFIKLDEDYVDAAQEFYANYVNHYFDLDNNVFVKSLAELESDNFYMPYDVKDINSFKELPFIYIVQGHRVINRLDYESCYNIKGINSYNLQFCSFYPVILDGKASLKGQTILHDRINALGSDFIYTIVDGKVVSRKNNNSTGLLKSINSNIDIIEANINRLGTVDKIFKETSSVTTNNSKNEHNGLFGQYLEDLESDKGPSLETLFNLPTEDAEVFEEAEELESHLIEELNDENYVTTEELNTINYIKERLIVFSDKYLTKKVKILKDIKHEEADKIVKISELFINSIKELNKNDKIIKIF